LDDAYKDQATIAATAARSALDSLLNSEEVSPPELYDDLLTYYDIFLRALQERSYKDTGPEIKKQIESYIKAVEMLMYERARKNSMFAQKMAMVDMFPIFFTIPQEPPPMAVAGMTNAMEEQTMGGVAPKENPEAGMQMAQMAEEEQPTEGQ